MTTEGVSHIGIEGTTAGSEGVTNCVNVNATVKAADPYC